MSLAQTPAPPDSLVSGPFPRELHVERRGWWRVRHRLFDGDFLLGVFTQRWHGGVEFLSAQGRLYRTLRRKIVRQEILWVCATDVVAWVGQSRPWVRQYRLQYGGASYRLTSASPMSGTLLLHDEEEGLLMQAQPAGLSRSPSLTVHAPLPLELLALFYATALVLWRQTVMA